MKRTSVLQKVLKNDLPLRPDKITHDFPDSGSCKFMFG